MAGIPQVVIMTMIDQVCPLVKKDLRNVYKSKKIKKKVSWLFLGVKRRETKKQANVY